MELPNTLPYLMFVFISFALISNLHAQTVGCPTRCLCFTRDNGMVVRCMFVGLTEVPKVPRDTAILDLRFNRISTIQSGVFQGLTSLYTLLLNSNEITEVSDEAFVGLENLKYLYLYKNKIKSLGSNAFAGLGKLEQLLIMNNNNMDSYIRVCMVGTLLDNHGNQIQFSNDIYDLYAHSNEIDHINIDTFTGLSSLQRLFLHNNELRTIPKEALDPIHELTRLRLDSNPLVCNCDLRWLTNFTTHSRSLMEVAATCSEPPSLSGVAITEVEDSALHCPPEQRNPRPPPSPLSPTRPQSQPVRVPDRTSVRAQGRTPVRSPAVTADQDRRAQLARANNRIPTYTRPQLTAQPTDVQTRAGQRVYMHCSAEGNPRPKIAWFHNENEIVTNNIESSSRYYLLSDGTLMIEDTQASDNGNYGCMAQNDAGEAISGPATLIVQRETNSIIERRPEFILRPRDQTVSQGGSISLTCTVSGGVDVQWYKEGLPYTIDPTRSTLLSSGTMLITDVIQSDSGSYRCTASIGNQAVHATARVYVRERPYFTEEPSSRSVVEGGTAYFNCEASGHPDPSISWSRNGDELRDNVRFTISRNSTNLRVSEVVVSDAGRYECEAANTLATMSTYAFLTVRPQDPPEITTQASRLSVEVGASLTLPCEASGDPDPTISWRRYEDQILQEDDEKYEVGSNGYLTVNNITLEDAGAYECLAVNSVGSDKLTVHLQIVGAVERIYPGDRFVEEAVSTARSEVEQAAENTLRDLHDRTKPLTSSDLLALFKFPSQGAQTIARSAEIFERTLELIIDKVHDANKVQLESDDIYHNVRNILSPNQIRIIAELSGCAESRPPIDCTNMCFHKKYRSIDGTCNNFHNPMLGSSLTKFARWLPPVYENNFNLPVGWNTTKLYHGHRKPSARLISTQVMSTHDIEADTRYTSFIMQWGQFLDHDITLTPMSVSRARFSDGRQCNSTCENQAPCFPIQTPAGDPRLAHRRCMGMTRSSAACGSGMTSVFFNKITHREQLNELTAYIDASNIYGSEVEFARSLRDLARDRGLLRTGLLQTTSGKHLLPFNINAPMDCQIDPTKTHIPCFLAGDLRANEQLGLLSMHTLFLREHNRIARELGELNEHWDGDMVYHETRKIVGAIMQHITYQHWLPKIIGPVGMSILGEYKGYNPSEDATVMNVFATAAFRFGHTLINPVISRFNETMQEHSAGHLPLHKAFFAPFRIIEEGGIDPVLRGLFGTPAKMPTSTQVFNEELTEKLFKLAHAVALDLASLNIQRGRDHALPSYNEWRKKCGLNEASDFDALANEIPDVKVRMKLEEIYGHPGNIDLFVGATLEKLMPGARVGPTFMCILAEQFRRLRDGDRFYYESPGVFSADQLAELRQVTLSHLVCMGSDNITQVPKDLFSLSQYPRQYLKCDSGKIPELNLAVWAGCCHDCESSGDFQSITHGISSSARKRRSVEQQFSYPEDRPNSPEIKQDQIQTQGVEQINDQRIEGLEDTIDVLSETIKALQEKLESLETEQRKDGND